MTVLNSPFLPFHKRKEGDQIDTEEKMQNWLSGVGVSGLEVLFLLRRLVFVGMCAKLTLYTLCCYTKCDS